VIFAGNGVALSEASGELKALAELLGAPVATTLMGKGIFPENHPLALGTTGIWGTRAANATTLEADVILAVGTAFGEADCSSWHPKHTFSIPPSRVIQIDIDPQEVGKIYPVEIGLVGDAKVTLQALVDRLGKNNARPAAARSKQAEIIERRKRDWQAELRQTQEDSGKPDPSRALAQGVVEGSP
jgi:acetolactate synthase-1/2/3 large subunit